MGTHCRRTRQSRNCKAASIGVLEDKVHADPFKKRAPPHHRRQKRPRGSWAKTENQRAEKSDNDTANASDVTAIVHR